MAQRGLSAAFRAIFRSRQPASSPIPPDTLSSDSRPSSDEELLPSPPHPTADPSRSRRETQQQAPQEQQVPLALRRLGADAIVQAGPPPEDDTPSSHYSLRPRRCRKHGTTRGEPEPLGVETSRPRDTALGTPAQPLPSAKISVRPSLAAQPRNDRPSRSMAAPSQPPRPQLPAPSAGTTSGIAGRPVLLAVGDLDAAATEALRELCRNVGLSVDGSDEILRKRLRDRLGERRFLNEDTVVVGADGKPRLPSMAVASASGRGTDGGAVGRARDGTDGDHIRGFDLTTTTADKPATPVVPGPAKVKTSGATGGGGADYSVKGSVKVTGGGKRPGTSGVAQAPRPALEIPVKTSDSGIPQPSVGYRTMSSTGIGAPHDMPASPAPFTSVATFGGFVSGWGRPAADPASSVDGRGGSQRGTDINRIFRDLAGGGRNLSVKEYEACVKMLRERVSPADKNSAENFATLSSVKNISGAQLTVPKNGSTEAKAALRPGSLPVSGTGLHSARGSSAAGAGSAAQSVRKIPPAPPNTPGITDAPPLPLPGLGSAPPADTAQVAAAVLRATGGDVAMTKFPEGSPPLDRRAPRVPSDPRRDPTQSAGTRRKIKSSGSGHPEKNKEIANSDPSLERDIRDNRRPQASGSLDSNLRDEFDDKAPNVKTGALSSCPREFMFDLNEVEKPKAPKALPVKNPFRGAFAGAFGGPDARNTLGRNGVPGVRAPDVVNPENDYMDTDSAPMERKKSVAESCPPLSMIPANAVPGGTRFATPREIMQSFNREGTVTDKEVVTPNSTGREDAPHRDDPSSFDRERSRPFSTSTPASLPRHLRGFSAMGTLGGTPGRVKDPRQWPDVPGRVVGPSSFRPRRALSTSSGSMLLDLRNSTAAYNNTFIAEKMRRRGSVGESSTKRPPLPASTVRILEELKRVRDANRALITKKRNVSPLPVPPSVSKRARLRGSFSAGSSVNREDRGESDDQRLAGGNSDPVNVRHTHLHAPPERAGSRQQEKSSFLHLKPINKSGHKRKAIAFGIGKRRSRPASLSKAALSEMKSLVEKNTARDEGVSRSAKEPVSQFTFGETFRQSPLERKQDTPNEKEVNAADAEQMLFSNAGENSDSRKVTSGLPAGRPRLPAISDTGKKIGESHSPFKRPVPERPSAANAERALFATMKPVGSSSSPQTGTAFVQSALGVAGVQQGNLVKFSVQSPQTPSARFEGGTGKPVPGGLGDASEGKKLEGTDHGKNFAEKEKQAVASSASFAFVSATEKKSDLSKIAGEADQDAKDGSASGEHETIVEKGRMPEQTAPTSFPASVDGVGAQPKFGSATLASPAIFGLNGPQAKGAKSSMPGEGAEPLLAGANSGSREGLGLEPPVSLAKSFDIPALASSHGMLGSIPSSAPRWSANPSSPTEAIRSGSDEAKQLSTAPVIAPSAPALSASVAFGGSIVAGHSAISGPEVAVTESAETAAKSDLINSDVPGVAQGLQDAVAKVGAHNAPPNSTTVAAPLSSQEPARNPSVFAAGANPLSSSAPGILNTSQASEEKPSTELKSGPSHLTSRAAGTGRGDLAQTGILFGAVPVASSAAEAKPFVFGAGQPSGLSGADATIERTSFALSKTPPSKETADQGDLMNTSATPPAGSVPPPEARTSIPFPQSGSSAGSLFGQPASSSAGGVFSTSHEGGASGVKGQGGFAFGSTAPEGGKGTSGPFGAPQFTSKLSAAPNPTTFVFGKDGGPQPPAVSSGASGSGAALAALGGASSAATFSGFQNPALAFGSSQAGFAAPSLFGATSTTSVPSSSLFGAPTSTAPGFSGPTFGNSQSAFKGTTSIFGTSQPAPSTSSNQATAFAFGGASTPASSPAFSGFGSSVKAQQPFNSSTSFGTGAPSVSQSAAQLQFGQPQVQQQLGQSSSTQQGQFGTGFGGGASFGANPSGDQGAFSMGSNQPGRRSRKILKARRTLR